MTILASARTGLEFKIQMTSEAIEYHQNGDADSGPCCTADRPCATRATVARLNAEYREQLATLTGATPGERPAAAPAAERRATAGAGRSVQNPASDKQVAYITKLAAQHDVSEIGTFPARTLAAIQNDEASTVSIKRASDLIDVLRRQPLAAAWAPRLASDKQLGFIRSLTARKGYTFSENDLTSLSPQDASKMIDMLQGLEDAPKPQQAGSDALEDGMYRMDGIVYKVQHAVNGSGRQYAKQLIQDHTGAWSFEYATGAIRRLRPEHRMTLAEAKEFGALYGTCCVCGRTLTDEKSIAAGIGPICGGRV